MMFIEKTPVNLIRSLVLFALVLSLFGCTTPRVNVVVDREARTCEVKVTHQFQTHEQVIQDIAPSPRYNNVRLGIRTSTKEDLRIPARDNDSSAKIFVYRLSGSCIQNKEVRKQNPKAVITQVFLSLSIPAKSLKNKGDAIVSGMTPEQLVRKGFSITFYQNRTKKPISSEPEVFGLDNVVLGKSRLKTAGLGDINLYAPITCFAGQDFRIIAGTLTVPPHKVVSKSGQIESVRFSRNDVSIDKWELDGVLSNDYC